MITLRPWLDRLLLATLVVTTWHKLHWAPGAGDVTLEDVLAAGFVGLFITDRCLRRDWRMHRVALGLLLAMAVLEAVYLGGYFALQNGQELSQYAKGMTKFALHFGFLVCGTQHVIDRGERMLRRTIGAFILGLLINCAYGVAQLAAQVGARDQPRQAPSSARSRSGRAASAASTSTARRRRSQQGSYVSLGVYRVNALALDPNHLGIMLCRADPAAAAVRAARRGCAAPRACCCRRCWRASSSSRCSRSRARGCSGWPAACSCWRGRCAGNCCARASSCPSWRRSA